MKQKDFLDALGKFAHEMHSADWFIDADGKLRTWIGFRCCCPIEALATHITGSLKRLNEAADALNLDDDTTGGIIIAADARRSASPKLRAALLRACGLTEHQGRAVQDGAPCEPNG